MLQRIARLAIAGPRRTCCCRIGLGGRRGLRATGMQSLSAGGFQDPAAESAQAIAADRQVRSDQQLVLVITAPSGDRETGQRARWRGFPKNSGE